MATRGASSVIPVTESSRASLAAPRLQTVTIVESSAQTPTVKSFVFKPSVPFSFLAGQHVEVRLTAPDGYRAQRSYSIASAPEDPERLEIAVERLRGGEVSPFFHEVAAPGDEIELRGPIGGHFIWSTADGGPVLLVGAGSGVAPLMSMIRHRAARQANIPMLLLLSARTWEDVIFREELLALHERRDGFMLALAITREPARREGDFGKRTDSEMFATLLGRLPSPPKRTFVCGSNAFVSVASDALVSAGVAASAIRTERYGQ